MVPTTHAFITLGAEPKGPTGGFRGAARSPYWRRDFSQQEFCWGWFGQAGRLCLHIIFMSSLFSSRALLVQAGVLPSPGKHQHTHILICMARGLYSAGPLAPPGPGGSSGKPRLLKC